MAQKFKLQLKDVTELYLFYSSHPDDCVYPHEARKDKLRYNRLKTLCLLNDQGTLNQLRGKKAIEKFLDMQEMYKEGVSWDKYYEKRKKPEWRVSLFIHQINHIPWVQVQLPGVIFYTTNQEIIIAGNLIKDNKKERSMKTEALVDKTDLDLFIIGKINEYDLHKEKWVEIKPHTFCWDILTKDEVLWFTDKFQDLWIPIRAQYMKFALNRFLKKLKFYAKDKDSFIVAVAPPTKKINMYRHVAACILPLETIGIFHIPDTIYADWEEKFIDKKKRRLV